MINDLYREEILEHYKNPQNYGKLKNYSTSSQQTNPFCGDDITLYIKYLKTDKTNGPMIIEDISFVGSGCAISTAGASILTEFAKQKTRQELLSIDEDMMIELLGVTISDTRKKCALLALATLKEGLA